MQAALFELDTDFLCHIFGASHLWCHCAAQYGNSGVRAAIEPRAILLMVPGGGSKIPQDRLVVLRQQGEAVGFVLRPGAYVRGGEVAHIVPRSEEHTSEL